MPPFHVLGACDVMPRITNRHIALAFNNDEELNCVCKDGQIFIPDSGNCTT